MKSKEHLSKSIISQIRHYCFDNIGECHSRHKEELGMALTTFYKIMEGDYVSIEFIRRVETFAETLVVTPGEVTKRDIYRDLLNKIDAFSASEKMEDWIKVKNWIASYRGALELNGEI